MKGFPDLPPLWLVLFFALAWLLATYLPLVTVFGPVLRGLGWGAMAAGIGLIVWSAVWFRVKRTTIEPHHAPAVLIVEGPYRLSRNPIYLGMLVILAGFVASLGALSPVPLPILFAAVLKARFIDPEEAALRKAFGPDATAYIARTRRWL